jgi:hemoglobin/transferrin/lactoferrin receptor protein
MGPVSHKLTIGGDSAWDRVRTADFAGGFVSALTPGGNRNIAGAFVQDEARFGWLRVLGALRHDSYSLNGGGFSSSGDRLSPKITVGVSPIRGIEFYGTYAEGYRAPAITETLISGTHPFPAFQLLANPAVQPETAHNLEAGVNLKYDNVFHQDDSFRPKAAIFTNTVDNDLMPVGPTYFVPFSPVFPAASCSATPRPFYCVIPITSYQYVNIAKARLEGAEVEAAYDWGDGFVSISGSHVDGRNEATGAALATVPPDRVSGTLGFRFLDRALTISSRLRLVSDSNSSSVIATPTKGYGLVDIFASYKYSENISADLSVTNLFNRQYVQYLDTLASPGLTANLGVTIRFASR